MKPTTQAAVDGVLGVDRLVHEPARLAILTVLSGAEQVEFGFLETVCRLRGTRVDTEETMEVAFTMAEAEKVAAKEGGRYVPLSETRRYREYPSDMLFARALSRLHRRLFPDATKLEDPATRGG